MKRSQPPVSRFFLLFPNLGDSLRWLRTILFLSFLVVQNIVFELLKTFLKILLSPSATFEDSFGFSGISIWNERICVANFKHLLEILDNRYIIIGYYLRFLTIHRDGFITIVITLQILSTVVWPVSTVIEDSLRFSRATLVFSWRFSRLIQFLFFSFYFFFFFLYFSGIFFKIIEDYLLFRVFLGDYSRRQKVLDDCFAIHFGCVAVTLSCLKILEGYLGIFSR